MSKPKGYLRSKPRDPRDMSHDLYHRAARRLEPNSPDGRMTWPHDGECEWARANNETVS